ncbi:MAG: IS21 family transposase [Desulfobacteraceae bacterium]|jgi:transposase|nr:IS21 family transposase [Desulfobacteraceae bacterium]
MQFIANREQFENAVVTMHVEGWSIRALQRHFGVGRNTIRRILRKHDCLRDQGHDRLAGKRRIVFRSSKLDPFVPQIKELFEKYPDITGQRVFEQLKDAGYGGGISILRDRLRILRPRPKKQPVVRFETEPGGQAQMDWSPYTIRFLRTGKQQVLCFSYILGFSRRQYIDFTIDRKFYTLIRRHQDAFSYYGGVCRQCLYDGEKTVVLRWEAGQPVFNPAFVSFITHYECKPVACRPGRAQTKGKIEAPFLYVEKNLLNGRDFQDLDDLKATARWWMAEKSDLHLHDTTRRAPIELFLELEHLALQPLPAHSYDSCEVALRVCEVDGFIEFETNRYSVPYEYVADILTFKASEKEIFIYSPHLDLIATHPRHPYGARKKEENPEHRISKKVRYGLEPVRQAFLDLGDAAADFIAGLKEKYPRNCGFHARFILRLKERYHCEDINRALGHAIGYHAFDSKAIERILAAKARPRTLESVLNDKAREKLKQALPEIKQRPLEEYCQLLWDQSDEEKR